VVRLALVLMADALQIALDINCRKSQGSQQRLFTKHKVD
jgi:hypothetical protein